MKCVSLAAAIVLTTAPVLARAAEPAADPRFVWDLSELYANDAAFDAERKAIADALPGIAALKGTLGRDAASLARAMHAIADLHKRLDRLETAHLIERHPDPSDRRGVLIKLSNTGLDLIDRAVVAVTELESSAVGNAIGSDKERLQLENGLRRMLTAHERP